MRIAFDDLHDDYRISVDQPGRWDGHPRLASFTLGRPPSPRTSVDRLAVASTLCYSSYLGGVLHYSEAINIVTANAIQRFCAPASVHIPTIDEGPKPIEHGSSTITIAPFAGRLEFPVTPTNFCVFIADRTEYSGSLNSQHFAIVTSNAKLFSVANATNLAYLAVAVGVLYSTELSGHTIRLAPDYARRIDKRNELRDLRDLLSAVGLSLEASSE